MARTEDAVVGTHPYAVAKGITWAAGAGRVTVPKGKIVGDGSDCLMIPIRSMDWRVIAVQCINTAGAKQTFGPMQDGCLILGNTLDLTIPWVVVEGWADAVSITFHIYKGNAVGICAFGKERMEKVARTVADHYRPERITILEDAT
jgi:putative DNA primase/helicase